MESNTSYRKHIKRALPLGLVLAALLALYLHGLQRIPNGADHYFMIDVGETQIVLNNWGTLHATGYPHYVILSNLITAPLRWMGVRPLVAAALVSTLWGLLAAALFYRLASLLTRRAWLAALTTLLYGLTRTVWVHNVIAEIYTFGLWVLLWLLWMALSPPPPNASRYGRLYALALLGGAGVAHHRAVAMVAPALLFAMWAPLWQIPRRVPRVLITLLGLGLIGFVPYAYLMLRARMGAAWVYGEPATLRGLWAQFSGEEAARFIGLAADVFGNGRMVNSVLQTDLSALGVLLGVVGLAWGITQATQRRVALTLSMSAAVAYGFHVLFYTDILSALILPVTLSLVLGWVLLAENLLARARQTRALSVAVWIGAGALAGVLVARNAPFIYELTTDPRGEQVIALAAQMPPDGALMIPWGVQHFAVGYALDIERSLPPFTLQDHKADYRAAFASGGLHTLEYVRFMYPPDWWQAQLGAEFYAQAAGFALVQLQPQPTLNDSPPAQLEAHIVGLSCTPQALTLTVDWRAPADPLPARSIFVHLLDDGGNVLAQADQFAPVYGWRPFEAWQPAEVVRDVYRLPAQDRAQTIRFGLYYQNPAGEFINESVYETPIECS